MAINCVNYECKQNDVLKYQNCREKYKNNDFNIKKCEFSKVREYHPGEYLTEINYGDRYNG